MASRKKSRSVVSSSVSIMPESLRPAPMAPTSRRPQFRQSAPAAREKLVYMGVRPVLRSVREDVEIMDQEDIDPVQSQALIAVLDRPHHRIVAVVEAEIEIEPAGPKNLLVAARRRAAHAAGVRPWWKARTRCAACRAGSGRYGARSVRSRTPAPCRNSGSLRSRRLPA